MSFTNPIWLWGLTGLIVPVAVHVLSLKEGRIIYMGSLRHLRESNTAQFSSIRLNEILLLIIRSLLIILLVLILAGLHFNVEKHRSDKWLVVDREVFQNPDARILIDSLQQDGYEVHLLNHGFPSVSDSAKVESKKNNWMLAQELADKRLQDVIVITHNFAKDYRGERAAKPDGLKWISVEPSARNFEANKIALTGDSVWSRMAQSTSKATKLNSRWVLASGSSSSSNVIRILLYADRGFEYDAKIILAVLQSIDTVVPFTIEVITDQIDSSKLSGSDWVIWLSRRRLTIDRPNVIAFGECHSANLPIIQRTVESNLYCDQMSHRWWTITGPLTEDIALSENLSIKLASILIGGNETNLVSGQRALPEESIWSTASQTVGQKPPSVDALNGILLFLFGFTLVAERLVAFNRKQ